jgi:ABC-type molybdenum transport system ATPase subunit/photorepair protein PhrA
MCALPKAIRGLGTELVLEGADAVRNKADGVSWAKNRRSGVRAQSGKPKPVVEMRGVDLAFGHRVLFKDFSWTVCEGERWVLRGPNGSGKTTLLALVTGDSPLSYAFDIRLFGKRRGKSGVVLADLRRHVGTVSAEREAMLGEPVEVQLDAALVQTTRLLLLDEPCCNLSAQRSRAALERVARWLDAHPKVAAVCVAHSKAHVPAGFDRQLMLPVTNGKLVCQ